MTPGIDNARTIGQIPKNERTTILIRRYQMHDHDLVDLRAFTIGENGQPEFPTKHGFSIRVALVPELYRVVTELMFVLASEADAKPGAESSEAA